ncbi:c-type cytochrome [Stappia stellulata]|uniref:c-type cytochrome n=1 Tax=Stappia stellulata TaxID=71235 RepID=UPI000423B460|nr:cytochrome c [Stappia stellulata]
MTHVARCALVVVFASVGFAAWSQDHDAPARPGTHDLGSTVDRFTDTDGATLFRRACSGCHGSDGEGVSGAAAYPALAGNARMSTARYPVNLILEGNGAMPSFAEWLDDSQVAAIVNFLRSNLGNSYQGEVTAEAVARMRKEFAELEGG